MGFEFERRPGKGRMARWVDAVWFARGQISYAREHIAPTGATVAVLNLGDPIVHATEGARATRLRATTGWLSGPHDRPSLNEPTGRTHCYGVVSTPIGSLPLFGFEPRELRGRVVPLERWKAGPAVRKALAGLRPVAGLALLLERLILRVRRLLSDLDVFADPDWVAQTAAYGCYDQSHLIRDFKRYTGVTPTAYVAAQRAHFAPAEADDASGFVPQGPPREVKSVQDAAARDLPE